MIHFNNITPNILVIGDLILDEYLWGDCDRISPEAPVQIIKIHNENQLLGGAGNVIHNLKTLGAKVDVLSVLSNCDSSKKIRELFSDINVDLQFIVDQKNRVTSKKSRVIASQQQVVRFDRENTESISDQTQSIVIDTFNKIVNNYDVILISDYGKGLLTKKLTQTIIKVSNDNNKKVLVDPKGQDYSKYKDSFLLTPNIKEASEATNIDIKDDESLLLAIKKLKSDCNLDLSLITLSEKGVAIFGDEFRIHPTTSREVFDVTGAGDTVLASLGFAIACEIDIDSAVQFSNLASGVVVGKIGSATVTVNEVIEYESSLNQSSSSGRIKTQAEISIISEELKSKGKKIVFTNGCFDLLHAGHVQYLEDAKSCGDVLIVGLNSDESVGILKGKGRPINNQLDRAIILAALEAIDYVVIFNENTPYELIKEIKPNTLVKGADYEGKAVIGEDIADEMILVKYIDNKSSSLTIKKIKNSLKD